MTIRRTTLKKVKERFGKSAKELFVEHIQSKNVTNNDFCARIGIHPDTYFRWLKEFGIEGVGTGHSKIGQKRAYKARVNKGQITPLGHKRINSRGYYETKTTHQKRYNYTAEHRLIVESLLGRSLYKNECVHHIDDNKLNNDTANLIVITKYQHRLLNLIIRHSDKRFIECLLKTITKRALS